MDTNWESAAARGGPLTEQETRLLPVLARVVELGRGPPALVRWVRDRLDRASGPRDRGGPDVRGLARELARILARDGLTGTLPNHAGHTLRLPAGPWPQPGDRSR